jgi:hypothetical protein
MTRELALIGGVLVIIATIWAATRLGSGNG